MCIWQKVQRWKSSLCLILKLEVRFFSQGLEHPQHVVSHNKFLQTFQDAFYCISAFLDYRLKSCGLVECDRSLNLNVLCTRMCGITITLKVCFGKEMDIPTDSVSPIYTHAHSFIPPPCVQLPSLGISSSLFSA